MLATTGKVNLRKSRKWQDLLLCSHQIDRIILRYKQALHSFHFMRILHFSTNDAHGGAAKYAYHLHNLLRKAGVESHLIVKDKLTDDPTVIQADQSGLSKTFRRALKHLPIIGKQKT